MHQIGRYDQIRCWAVHQHRLSPPFALDRGRAQGQPTMAPLLQHPEWQQYTERTYERLTRRVKHILRDESGIVGFNPQSGVKMWFGAPSTTPSAVGRALSVAYVPGTSGNAVGARIITDTARTLSYCYCYLTSYTGTAASVAELDFYAATDAGGVLPTTASNLATGTTTLSSATGWIKGPTFNTSLTAMTPYWLIVGDTNGGATNFANISSGGSATYQTDPAYYYPSSSHRTTGGWAGSNTVEARIAQIIGVFSDGTAVGDPFTTDALPTNDSNDKGLYLNGLTTPLSIVAIGGDANIASATGIKVYASATSAGGSTLATGTTIAGHSTGRVAQGFYLSAPYTIPAATALRLVFYGGGNFQSPRKKQIGTIGIGSATDLAGAFPFGGVSFYTGWNGSAWVNDATAFPVMYVWIQDQVASTPGGPGSLVGGRGGLLQG